MRLLMVLLLALILAVPARAGIILNTLEGYETVEPGVSGEVSALFSGSGGNTEEISLEGGLRLQWQDEVQRLRLQFSGEYQENANVETGRNVVGHLRHNHHLGEKWSSILFAQIQHNPFQHLEQRWLLGAGARFDVTRGEKGVVTLGCTPMLEIERVREWDSSLSRGRLSVFLHAARNLSTNTRLDATAFWQPLFSDLGKARAVGNLTLEIDITGSLELQTGLAVEHNAHPPAGVEETDWKTFTGLGFDF